MFCGNCGKQIENTDNVCPYCGAMVEKETTVVNDNKYAKIFVESDENYLGSLGNGYLNSFLTNRGIKRCVALLSDRRLYLRGQMVDINNGKMGLINRQQTIDLEDITGTGFIYASPQIWKLILAVMLFGVGFLCSMGTDESIRSIIISIVGAFWISAILLMVSYIKNRNTFFVIEYAGGCIKFDASIYGLAESQDFEKQIRRAKNQVKGKK